eukprot:gene57989-77384_t
MPTAPPNSAPVSAKAEAAPAFSGGALLMINSVPKVNIGDKPKA